MIATSCPYCLIMLDDAVNAKRAEGQAEGVTVIDIAQVIADSIGLRRVTASAVAESDGDGAVATLVEVDAETERGQVEDETPAVGPQDAEVPEQPLESSTETPDGPTIDPSDAHPGSTETVVQDDATPEDEPGH